MGNLITIYTSDEMFLLPPDPINFQKLPKKEWSPIVISIHDGMLVGPRVCSFGLVITAILNSWVQ